jgi:NAD(P)-dependent dehydrogenase (short-subunit alcohol dehydrogenase family)
VNAIVPGLIRTDAAEASSDTLSVALGQDISSWIEARQGRWGLPEEVAAVAVHLVSDEASFTSGLLYHVDQGAHAV